MITSQIISLINSDNVLHCFGKTKRKLEILK